MKVDLSKYNLKKIVSVSEGEEVPVFDIEVDSPEHAFYAKSPNGAIGISHNSALISLSNLSDDRMRSAKSGQWWIENSQRALANNSACYTEKPDVGIFMDEWKSLYESRSGERGIFNLVAAKKSAEATGRRDPTKIAGTNPCVTGDTKILTKEGNIPIKDLIGKEIAIWNGLEWSDVVPFSTGQNEIFLVTLSNGVSIKCTAYHKFILEDEDGLEIRIEAKNLLEGDKLFKYHIPEQPNNEISVVNVRSLHTIEETFCFTEPKNNSGTFNGIVTGQCSEILLKSRQTCNLSEVIVRPKDNKEILMKKVELATILGTMQATLSKFRYLTKQWEKNQEEEALLGVSLTGILDNKLTSSPSPELQKLLIELKEHAISINKKWAKKFGINEAASITCVKPSGCQSLSNKIKTSLGILSFDNILELTGEAAFVPGKWYDLKQELYVFDENNEPQLVPKVFVNGESMVYEIEFEDGKKFKFTPEHKLLTKNRGYIRIDELTVEDEIVEF